MLARPARALSLARALARARSRSLSPYPAQDTATYSIASALEIAINSPAEIAELARDNSRTLSKQRACHLQVRLANGKRMTLDGKKVCVYAHFELRAPRGFRNRRASRAAIGAGDKGAADDAGDDAAAAAAAARKHRDDTKEDESPPRGHGELDSSGEGGAGGGEDSALGSLVDSEDSIVRMWTNRPKWNQNFTLGPVGSIHSMVRVVFFHCNMCGLLSRFVPPLARALFLPPSHARALSLGNGRVIFRSRRYNGALTDTKPHFIGEATVELQNLRIKDEVVKSGEIVGWFPLSDPHGLAEGHAFSGRVKLGLKLVNHHMCADCPKSGGGTPSGTPGTTPRAGGFAPTPPVHT